MSAPILRQALGAAPEKENQEITEPEGRKKKSLQTVYEKIRIVRQADASALDVLGKFRQAQMIRRVAKEQHFAEKARIFTLYIFYASAVRVANYFITQWIEW